MAALKQLAGLFFESAAHAPTAAALRFFDKASDSWQVYTWAEYAKAVRTTAAWLASQGIGPGDRVAIFSQNRPEWLISDLAILALGAISVPIYATASPQDVGYILKHSEAKAMFVDHPDRLKPLSEVPLPQLVVSFDPAPATIDLKTVRASNIKPLAAAAKVDAQDIATIIYTSGTTGLPKGVVHTHGTMMATVHPCSVVLKEGATGSDRFVSFLPLSHVAERVLVQIGSIILKAEVTFARSVDTLIDDMVQYPPTILLCVPRLWERIYEKIRKGLETASPVKKLVFRLAESAGKIRISDNGKRIIKAHDATISAKLADTLVGKKLKQKLGMHKIRMFLTGSAPTRPEILRFFGGFGVFVREVYGLTENLCLGVYTGADEILIGSCGKVFPGGKIKIANDGEILLRAPWNFVGYYKNEQATKEALTADGWFMTGDLGQLDHEERLSITGRKKELLKTSTGKYVAPVPLEDELKILPLITDAMVVGDGQKYCIALIAIDHSHALAPNAEEVLIKHLESINQKRANHEKIVRLGIIKTGFSIEAGTLTPSLKLKRKAALEQYSGFIDQIYGASNPIIRQG